MADTFEGTIAVLRVGWAQGDEAKAKFMSAVPELEQLIATIDLAGELTENSRELVDQTMGDIDPTEIQDFRQMCMVTEVSVATAMAMLGGIIKNLQTSIAAMDQAGKSLSTYIGKIS